MWLPVANGRCLLTELQCKQRVNVHYTRFSVLIWHNLCSSSAVDARCIDVGTINMGIIAIILCVVSIRVANSRIQSYSYLWHFIAETTRFPPSLQRIRSIRRERVSTHSMSERVTFVSLVTSLAQPSQFDDDSLLVIFHPKLAIDHTDSYRTLCRSGHPLFYYEFFPFSSLLCFHSIVSIRSGAESGIICLLGNHTIQKHKLFDMSRR